MVLWVLSNYTICKMLSMIWHYCSIRFCLAAFNSPLKIFWVFTRYAFQFTPGWTQANFTYACHLGRVYFWQIIENIFKNTFLSELFCQKSFVPTFWFLLFFLITAFLNFDVFSIFPAWWNLANVLGLVNLFAKDSQFWAKIHLSKNGMAL